ncbi:phenazine biosynthesis protein [Bordetella genomosp. 11]|uniref:Phenazine biosynthesis protein n=1 Tax=Bordetella genomosp. 11 TaxID=1416808 RepID=A0A261UN40_9BORD|nr:phenazine biosynthesis protein [Bordetella genomosp. 11]
MTHRTGAISPVPWGHSLIDSDRQSRQAPGPSPLAADAAYRPHAKPPAEPLAGQAILLDVFIDSRAGKRGGNPVPLVLDAARMTSAGMQALAARYGHESAFVLPAQGAGEQAWRLRFFVPDHEMEMCGHATVGTLWALRQWGRWTARTARVQTLSGAVDVVWDDARGWAWVSQPGATVAALRADHLDAICGVLGIARGTPGLHAVNAGTSRVKTLIRLPDAATLDALEPDFGAIRDLCESIGSTGLYPYVQGKDGAWARQFPKASGYPEDAATGIAAAALWGYLRQQDQVPRDGVYTVRQGVAMGAPSAIHLRAREDAAGCWLSGEVRWREPGADTAAPARTG